MKEKISIIVCAYNGEKYINRCMTSIVNQTLGIEAFQIILVNDASTDNTLDYMKEWESKYPDQIIVITYNENRGAGGARNIGLQYAKCEYVGYIDCDDWVEKSMYEKLYDKAVKFECDVVRCKYSWDVKNDIFEWQCQNGEDKFYKKEDFKEEYPFWEISLDTGVNGDYGSFCCGIYKKSMLIENEISFPENLYYEDNYFGELLNIYTQRLYIVDEILYHYYININSTSKKPNDIRHLERLKVEVLLLNELKKRGIYQRHKEVVEMKFIYKFYLNTMHILFTKFDTIPNIFPKMRQIVLKEFPNYRRNHLLANKPIWNLLLELLDIEPACTVEELETIKQDYLALYRNSDEGRGR